MSDFLKQIRDDHHQFDQGVLEQHVGSTPFDMLQTWFKEAVDEKCNEPNAMHVTTHGLDGFPVSRVVYLKEIINHNLIFYTNYDSSKGKEIFANPKVSLHFFWPELGRQIHLKGLASRVEESLSDYYFSGRPRTSQLGAWASKQSEILENRKTLEHRVEELEKRFPNKVERPPHWGGFQIEISFVEFWQGRSSRLHDRICFDKSTDNNWTIYRKNP
jgi:pyridoxamine 5'-phosphate oxidase